jgi:hypothetical protein
LSIEFENKFQILFKIIAKGRWAGKYFVEISLKEAFCQKEIISHLIFYILPYQKCNLPKSRLFSHAFAFIMQIYNEYIN